MEVILCATRGGEASIRTQDKAIALAKERHARLVFVFVSDVRFLHTFTAPHMPTFEREMRHLGEFLLVMAKERAEAAGVEADYTVREGIFREALIAAARDNAASVIVLGRPGDASLTTEAFLQDELAPALEEATGAEVIIV